MTHSTRPARPRTRALRAATAALACAAALTACSTAADPTVAAAALDLARPTGAGPLAATTVYTSPDGGIYRNPDPMRAVLLTSVDPAPIAAALGTGTSAVWAPLRPLGRFVLIGVRLVNRGAGGSDPLLADLQVAVDATPGHPGAYAPPQAQDPSLARFYHPDFPLAVLSDRAISDTCSVHLDPGQSATVLLLYPPLLPAPAVVWGRFRDFALSVPAGRAAAPLPPDLHARTCPVPTAPPA